jgi:hypothetical protein
VVSCDVGRSGHPVDDCGGGSCYRCSRRGSIFRAPLCPVRAHSGAGWTGRLVPLRVDGLNYASSMVMLDSARQKVAVHALARWLLGMDIAPAVALVGSYEVLMVILRSGRVPAGAGASDVPPGDDSMQAQAAEMVAGEVAAGRVPSVRGSAPGCTSGSHGHTGFARTQWPLSTPRSTQLLTRTAPTIAARE